MAGVIQSTIAAFQSGNVAVERIALIDRVKLGGIDQFVSVFLMLHHELSADQYSGG